MKAPANALKERKQMNSNTMLLVITIVLFRPSSTSSAPTPASSAWPAA